MNYELAKELKDAGFKQGSATGDHHDGGGWIDEENRYYHHETGDPECYAPTLSELIEACGEGFDCLSGPIHDLMSGSLPTIWIAEGDNDTYSGECATPEEAVARLWLALNKKP